MSNPALDTLIGLLGERQAASAAMNDRLWVRYFAAETIRADETAGYLSSGNVVPADRMLVTVQALLERALQLKTAPAIFPLLRQALDAIHRARRS